MCPWQQNSPARPDLPGVCADRRAVPGLGGKQCKLNFLGEALKELMALPASEWNGTGKIVGTLKNVPL